MVLRYPLVLGVLCSVLHGAEPSTSPQGEATEPKNASSELPQAPGTPAKEPQSIDQAVRSLRGIQPSRLSDAEQKAKTTEIEKAWATLAKGGSTAAKALRQAVAEDRRAARKDDFFALGAATLLWQIDGAAEANEIAGIWQTADQTVNYNYVFVAAVAAARTRDPRVLPMLRALLHEKRGHFFVVVHVMNLGWPLCQEFVWNIFGCGGLATLEDVLAESKNPAELETAMLFLAHAQHLKALPSIRKLATHQDSAVRGMAIQCLGRFGHPDDFGFLTAGLNSAKAGDDVAYLVALSLYGDLRAVPLVARHFDAADRTVRETVLDALMRLPCPESLAAIRRRAESATDPEEKKACRECVRQLLKSVDMPWETYSAKAAAEQQSLFEAARKKTEQYYVLSPSDRKLDQAEFLKAAAEWQERHRITGGKYEWVEDRHVLAVATADDLPLLIDVRARVCERVSDECLEEVHILNRVMERIGRSRYREEVGLTTKVGPATIRPSH